MKLIYLGIIIILSITLSSAAQPSAGLRVEISVDGGSSYSAFKLNTWTCLAGEVYQTYGGSTDTWGLGEGELLGANFTNETFRVRTTYVLTGRSSLDFGSTDGGVDHLDVQVFYDAEPNMSYQGRTPTGSSNKGSTIRINASSDIQLDACWLTTDINGSEEGPIQYGVVTNGCYIEYEGTPDGELAMGNLRFLQLRGQNGPFNTTLDIINFVLFNFNSSLNQSFPVNASQFNVSSLVLNWTKFNNQDDNTYSKVYIKNQSDEENELMIWKDEVRDNLTENFEYNLSNNYVTTTYPFPDGLAHLYHLNFDRNFNETRDDENFVVHDFVGDHDGEVTQQTTANYTSKFGGAIDFPNQGWLGIGSGTDFNDTCVNGCTFMGWGYLRDNSSNSWIFSKRDDSPSLTYIDFRVSFSGKPAFKVGNGASGVCSTLTSSIGLSENRWAQLVATYNTTQMDIYVDGVHAGNRSCSGIVATGSVATNSYIGGTNTASPSTINGWDGLIDEVAIWNRSLSQSEVIQLYELPNGTYYWQPEITEAAYRPLGFNFPHINNWSFKKGEVWEFTIGTDPPPDTCEYISLNWLIDCSDMCNITSPVSVDAGGNITLTGTGLFSIFADITGWNDLFKANLCTIFKEDSANFTNID